MDDDDSSTVMPMAYCFVAPDRMCGPDCMAYLSREADVPIDPQQRHCLILVSAERLARHVSIGVKVASDIMSLMKTSDADRRRTEQRPPTPPTTRT